MNSFLSSWRAITVAGATISAALAAIPIEGERNDEPLHTIRAQDKIILQAATGNLGLTETIVVSPVDVKKENERPGANNVVHLLISPLWRKDGDVERPAFTAVKPYVTVNVGRVRRFALVRPDGEPLNSVNQMTPECRYVLTLEFAHVLPEKFTVTITMAQPSGIEAETELLYTPSNDGQAFKSGPPESFYTEFRIRTEPGLDPWQVTQGDKVLPHADSSAVRLERNADARIRFGVRE